MSPTRTPRPNTASNRPRERFDHERHAPDVENIFIVHFAERLRAAGIDVQDTLQRVHMALLTRTARGTPHDPERGAWTTWVMYVMRSVVSHAMRERRSERERILWGLGQERDAAMDARGESARPEPLDPFTMEPR